MTKSSNSLVGGTPCRAPTPGAYATAAMRLREVGIVTLPCCGDEGKEPTVRGFNRWRAPHSGKSIDNFARKFPMANLGILLGPSRLVVVDVDDATLITQMVSRFGATPLIVRTPSGGAHLYYRAGHKQVSIDLRAHENIAVEIKSERALVIAPPSINFSTGKPYRFDRGDWGDLSAIPDFDKYRLGESRTTIRGAKAISVGRRNNALFRELLAHAPSCDSLDGLMDVAHSRNEFLFEAPLPAAEVDKAARSAWGYQADNRNWVGSRPRIVHHYETVIKFAVHKKGGDAMLLLAVLQSQHARRNQPFAIDRTAMAKAGVLPGWSAGRIRAARFALIELGGVVRARTGRRRADGRQEPDLFWLSNRG